MEALTGVSCIERAIKSKKYPIPMAWMWVMTVLLLDHPYL